jgi:hypothetical protein
MPDCCQAENALSTSTRRKAHDDADRLIFVERLLCKDKWVESESNKETQRQKHPTLDRFNP